MKLLLRPNFLRDNARRGTKQIITEILSLGMLPLLTTEDAATLGNGTEGCVTGEWETLLGQCDIVLPIGGDGTVLHEARRILGSQKPLLGINAGRIGFLTQLELSELGHLSRLKTGEFRMSVRMLLEVELRTPFKTEVYPALNDVVFTREDRNRILDISVMDKGGKRLVLRQRADGMIFSTPTGSTGYSLSAGGPIVSPEMEMILLTAICPHTTFRCPLVLPPEEEYLVVEAHSHEKCGFGVSVDGIFIRFLKPGDGTVVLVRHSNQKVHMIDLGVRDYYKNLNDKLLLI